MMVLGVAAGLGSIEKKDQELLGTSEQRQCGAIRPACQATKSRLEKPERLTFRWLALLVGPLLRPPALLRLAAADCSRST